MSVSSEEEENTDNEVVIPIKKAEVFIGYGYSTRLAIKRSLEQVQKEKEKSERVL
jgi:hypothetical protein